MTALDTALIDAYTGGVLMPTASQDGFVATADVRDDGTINLAYVDPSLLQTQYPAGVFYVDDYGAVSRALSDPAPITEPFRTANVTAINAATAACIAAGGGTVYFGPGVYYTNAPVGIAATVDMNAQVIFRGFSPYLSSMIFTNDTTNACFRLHNTTNNLRGVYMSDIALRGGRTALSLVRCDYCRFNRIWMWMGDQFALQMYVSSENMFDNCFWTESAGTGDAIMMISSQANFTNGNFGEVGGGVVCIDSTIGMSSCTLQASVFYRGNDYTDYWTVPATPSTVSLAGFLGAISPNDFSIFLSNTHANIQSCFFRVHKGAILIDATTGMYVNVGGCQFLSDGNVFGGADFIGFIGINRNIGGKLALNVQSQFVWLGTDSGYFISDDANLTGALIISQLAVKSTATMTTPNIVGNQNNVVILPQLAV